MRFVWVDTETTGIEVTDSGAFEIAMILVDSGKVIAERCFFLNPLSDKIICHEEALKVNGYSQKDIESFPSEKEQIPKVAQFFEDAMNLWKKDGSKREQLYFAGYNVKFDIKHIQTEFERNGFSLANYFAMNTIADVFEQLKKAQAMKKVPYLPDRKLGTVCKHFGVPLESAHDAMADIKATRLLAIELYKLGVPLL